MTDDDARDAGLDPAAIRARWALPPGAVDARRSMGAPLLAALRGLADGVERCLPELRALSRWTTRPEAATLAVGWSTSRGARRGAPSLSIEVVAEGLAVRWGYAPMVARGDDARRAVEVVARAKRAEADTLAATLSALRAEGAVLLGARGEPHPLAEEEWLAQPGGDARFVMDVASWSEGETRVRWCADRAARLLGLAARLGGWSLTPVVDVSADAAERRAAVRSLRWDERALGRGAAPSGLVVATRAYVYDVATGWFAPAEFAASRPACAAHERLLSTLGARRVAAPSRSLVAVDDAPAARARLARWLAARGALHAEREAREATVLVDARDLRAVNDEPALEVLVRRALDDPSGDSAAALAGMLAGAPWPAGLGDDPVSVASRVVPRHAASAARGVMRLREVGALARAADGALGAVSECVDDPAVRPVLLLAVEHAMGSLDALPTSSPARAERAHARGWEIGAGLVAPATLESFAQRLSRYVSAAGLSAPLDLVRAFVVSLRVRRFTVLTGVSGTGKSRFAALFARFVTEASPAAAPRWAMIPVRPDWLDPRGLLGGVTGDGRYEDTAALRLILAAREAPDAPHVLILDEMNLARVEHYLAEFLSAMESGAPVPLHGRPAGLPTTDGARRVPAELTVPPNLFVIGTVNVDESTHPLSAKVLDRAWCWEFEPAPPSTLLDAWLSERRAVPAARPEEVRALLDPTRADDPTRELVVAMGRDGVGARVDALFEAMSAHGRPFGHRVASEVLRFVYLCEREGVDAPPAWWLDRAVLGKVLPRVSGSRREIEALLRALLPVFESGPRSYADAARAGRDLADGPEPPSALRASAAKAREMLARLERESYASFSR